MSSAKRGFTLIELLVVIAIIAALMALLLPVINRLRVKVQRAATLALMKEVSTAVQLYLDTYPLLGDDASTATGDWDQRCLFYLVRRPLAEGRRSYLELKVGQMAKGPDPCVPATALDADHILDRFSGTARDRLRWTVTNVKPSGALSYRYTERIELRSSAGTRSVTTDDIVMVWTKASGWDQPK